MKTLEEIKAELVAEKHTKTFELNGEVVELSDEQFQQSLNDRAEMIFNQETKEAEMLAAKSVAEAKLAALGLTTEDLQALGLGGN